jgi:hypothetical protein
MPVAFAENMSEITLQQFKKSFLKIVKMENRKKAKKWQLFQTKQTQVEWYSDCSWLIS